MLIFENYDISVYVTPLRQGSSGQNGSRRIAELAAEKKLLREAFPLQHNLLVAHTTAGAPYLATSAPVAANAGVAAGEPEEELPVISISHSRSIVALAVAPQGTFIGIDTETGDRVSQLVRVAPRFLSDRQLPFWGASPATLLWAWTIKEAIYKAAGEPGMGLRDLPLPLEVPVDLATPDCEVTFNGRRYTVMQIDCPSDPDSILMLVFSPPPPAI